MIKDLSKHCKTLFDRFMPWQVVGKTLIYMVEIFNMVQTLNLSYGTITRDSPFRSELVGKVEAFEVT